ncbi:unnamed protein product [Acanthoscelides obtectus]|uniref:Sulfotransferase domain-containing protein n=1 Tax=Acanthoscelides obtectus TaxID=200917 RepID=A0A9P0P5D4_ACAOB|nr:unnamed protein product [Acanthoscelides obtectus]CAK1648103.1 Sulfotransferase family cytosolic 1B member 1 [Acanthoscelides obtectus]
MRVSRHQLDDRYKAIYENQLGEGNSLWEFHPGKVVLPGFFENYVGRILDAPIRKDDVWLVSYPKTGSTWCQEMIWLIQNNLDFEGSRRVLQQVRAPLIEASVVLFEFTSLFGDDFTNSVDYVANLPSPRAIKTHLPLELLPTQLDKVKPKIIYTMRNPKDVCVSYYFHSQLLHDFYVDFDTFCEMFLNDAIAYGSFFNHCFEAWNKRHEGNILIIRYEDMKKDAKKTVRNIADFLGKTLSDTEVDMIDSYLSFECMRKNKGCNVEALTDKKHGEHSFDKTGIHFLRKGQVGDWKNYMSEEMSRKFDEWIKKNTQGTDLRF